MVSLLLFNFANATTAGFGTGADILLAVLGLLGVIGIIAAGSAYFYKGRADALISLQKEEINVLKDSNQRLTEQNTKLIAERKEFVAELKRMRTEIKNLRTLPAQTKQLTSLARTISGQHIEVIDKLTDIAQGLIETSKGGGKSSGK